MPSSQDLSSRRAVRLVIGGDVCPVNANEDPCVRGDAEAVFSDLLPVMRGADLCVVNLECPLIDRPTPIAKAGPVIGARRAAATVLPAAGVHAVTLANNHIMDHGLTGLTSTISACEEYGVAHFGAGFDIRAAQKILVQDVDGCRIGLLGVTHHEFSVAGRDSPGAAPMDPVEVHGQLRQKVAKWDVLLAFVHAGADRYPLPTPKLQKYCRYLIDMGASLVVCQHSHCPGSFEEYGGGLIVYGQGNLLFDSGPNADQNWFRGFLVEVEVANHRLGSYRFLPYGRGGSGVGVRKLEAESAELFLQGLHQMSLALSDPTELEARWRQYAIKRSNSYYQHFLPFLPGSRLLCRAARRVGLRIWPFSLRQRMILLNIIRCETHREALEVLLRAREP